jgi:hypothetical protein
MNEQEFRGALHDTMTLAVSPPPMNEVAMLDAAKRAHRLRRARFAAAASAAAVVLIAAGVTVTTIAAPDHSGVAGPPAEPPPQPDGTQTAGPHFDRGVAMIDELADAMPPGLETPEHLQVGKSDGVSPLRSQMVDQWTVRGEKVWLYAIEIPVSRAGGFGRIRLDVVTPGSDWTGEGCASTLPHSAPADCTDLRVDGRLFAHFTAPPDGDHPDAGYYRADEWVSYRYPDGTFVTVEQADDFDGTDLPQLAAQPLTQEQLVQLVTAPRFHLD